MKLIGIKRICITHLKKGCNTCPAFYDGKCMFGPKVPGLWQPEEISNFVHKVRGEKGEGNSRSTDIHKTRMD